ncbi:DUF3795 domain-containing protein [Bacteroidota bacterium]
MIAPCGMNCGVCIGYMRERKPCAGCRTDSENKPHHCHHCAIVHCEHLAKTTSNFCYECDIYPCARLKRLDKRYRSKYRMSMIENLDKIRDHGLEIFLDDEDHRWNCEDCGRVVSVHRNACDNCGSKLAGQEGNQAQGK